MTDYPQWSFITRRRLPLPKEDESNRVGLAALPARCFERIVPGGSVLKQKRDRQQQRRQHNEARPNEARQQ